MRNFTRKRMGKTMGGDGAERLPLLPGGRKSFEQLLHGDNYLPTPAERVGGNVFMERPVSGDVWQQANPEEDFSGDSCPGNDEFAHEVQVDRETLAALDALDGAQNRPAHSTTPPTA